MALSRSAARAHAAAFSSGVPELDSGFRLVSLAEMARGADVCAPNTHDDGSACACDTICCESEEAQECWLSYLATHPAIPNDVLAEIAG